MGSSRFQEKVFVRIVDLLTESETEEEKVIPLKKKKKSTPLERKPALKNPGSSILSFFVHSGVWPFWPLHFPQTQHRISVHLTLAFDFFQRKNDLQ